METQEFQKLLESLAPQLLPWGMKLLGALAFLIIGRWVARAVSRVIKRVVLKARDDKMLASFLSNIAYFALLVAVVIGTIDTLGFKTASLIAVLGAAGLAIGLALQGSLSNLSSGVMLILFRPFSAGHFVEVAGVSGTVEVVKIFNTVIRTPDNREIIVPNSHIFGETITNYSARDTRRVDLVIGIGYDDDVEKAKEVINKVLADESRVLPDPEPVVMLLELADSSVNFAVRPWVNTSDYWPTRGALLERIKAALEENGLSIPFPQRDVHLHQVEAA